MQPEGLGLREVPSEMSNVTLPSHEAADPQGFTGLFCIDFSFPQIRKKGEVPAQKPFVNYSTYRAVTSSLRVCLGSSPRVF